MGLRDTIRQLVNSAITSSLDDLPTQATFKKTTRSSYNPTTGAVSNTVTSYTVTGVLTALTQQDVTDLSMVATGQKFLVPTLQLGGVDPDALDDTVVVGDTTWNIYTVKVDPAGALYTFILKARGNPSLGN